MTVWIRIDQGVCVAALLTLVGSGVALAVRALRAGVRPTPVAGALVALAAAVRLATAPSFVHSDLQGYALIESILDFPAPSTFRADYGQATFLVLGALARLLHAGWRGIAAINCVANVGILIAAAWLA